MLFNSYEFILAFLPVTVMGFLLLGLVSRWWALTWLILASIFFYAWWRPFNLFIIGPSLLINYVIGQWLLDVAGDDTKKRKRAVLLTLGIVFNVCFLGYFKYANFALTVVDDVAGADFVLKQIILPLGISFITFQKIAFLIDVAGGRIKSFSVRDFMLFVMFFPQLIAGPITHFQELSPQFAKNQAKFDKNLYATALTLFIFGLFKKVVLADGMAEHVTPVFAYAAAGHDATMLQSWLAAIGYTVQIYFDFSGYSDMACGAALFFGIRLPMNFDSPLKATNIVDFWLRWHITLTRFLTAYVYTPLTLALIRKRAAKKLPPLKARGSKVMAFVQVLAWPTILTMLLSGIWHGAGYTFIVWGLLHGLYLVIGHAWRQYGPKKGAAKPTKVQPSAMPAPVAMSILPPALLKSITPLWGWALTFLCVAVAMVLFRAPDLATAGNILKGMTGLQGLGMPKGIGGGEPMTVLAGVVPLKEVATAMGYMVVLLAIALLMPNSLQMLNKFQPTLQGPPRPPKVASFGPKLEWAASMPWMLLMAGMAAVSMWKLTGVSEFLYWQF